MSIPNIEHCSIIIVDKGSAAIMQYTGTMETLHKLDIDVPEGNRAGEVRKRQMALEAFYKHVANLANRDLTENNLIFSYTCDSIKLNFMRSDLLDSRFNIIGFTKMNKAP